MHRISLLNKLKATAKPLVGRVRKLYGKRPVLVIGCTVLAFLFVSSSAYAAYKAVYTGRPQTATVDTQKPKSNSSQTTAMSEVTTSDSIAKEEASQNNTTKKSANTSNQTSPSAVPTNPTSTSQPDQAPTAGVPPYYGAVLPPTVIKTDNGATMTYTIALTIIPNETFGNPMIRLQLFHPGVCINNSDLTRIYRYNSQNTLSMSCVIDKSQPAYGMTDLTLDFSINKDNGDPISGAASGWTHTLPQNYNQ